ncbi:MAG: hypothetical protein EBV01_14755 [Betaproteobacteria bacterium]|jgi:hypothetical protein|nr:hypothetical protein [Betaproteobacteria bacterium]
MINEQFANYYQSLFKAEFENIRARYSNSTIKGTRNEIIIQEFLRQLLPAYMKIGNGEVIDTEGNRSSQTDIIVADSMLQPFIKNYSIPELFIVEAVTCGGESKAILTKENLQDCLKKSDHFKKLNHKPAPSLRFNVNQSDLERFFNRKPFFTFAFESSLEISEVQTILDIYYKGKDINTQLDAIFILNKGSIINFGDGKGDWQFINPGDEITEGFIPVCDEKKVILCFISWLFRVMHKTIAFTDPISRYLPINQNLWK